MTLKQEEIDRMKVGDLVYIDSHIGQIEKIQFTKMAGRVVTISFTHMYTKKTRLAHHFTWDAKNNYWISIF
jgi:hypothetical protein